LIMRRLQLLLTCVLLAPQLAAAQGAAKPSGSTGETGNQTSRLALLFDLQGLDADASKLNQPLARARARMEIADAAWLIDREWAKKLLRDAYELTFPEEKERERLRQEPVGSKPLPPTDVERARTNLRNRVFAVAGRDSDFADELRALGAQELGRVEESERDRSLAWQALRAGDLAAASRYVSLSIKAEPTQGAAWEIIPNVAARDRAAADRLLLEYIEQLRGTPLSMTNGSAPRVHLFLYSLMMAGSGGNDRPLPPPGLSVLKAYVGYVVESMTQLSQREPESLRSLRTFLLAAWVPLKQYAPELTGAFMELERLSRRPGEDAGLPTERDAEARKARREESVRQAIKNGQPDDATIGLALGHKDFAAARKLIGLLPAGEKKLRLTDWVNAEESLSLAAGGEAVEAEKLARLLTEAESVRRVYPVLIGKCIKAKDSSCATLLTDQAVKQLRRATDGEALALSLCALANALAPVNEGSAFDVLEEAVAAANTGRVEESELGRLSIEPEVFKMLATKDKERARQVAQGLKPPAARITALAATYQQEAKSPAKENVPQPKS
ncbi:MAG: hypothetical protein LC774_05845, partial [Acidobacteria bacterium]|nr:hypothetical protein [Acidobacteriota bacterium]